MQPVEHMSVSHLESGAQWWPRCGRFVLSQGMYLTPQGAKARYVTHVFPG